MLVEKINDRMEPHVVQVDGVTLLSEDEYEAYRALIPPIHRWWWLRRVNAPVSGGYAGHVDLDGQVHYERAESDNGGVRPALTTSGFGAASLFPGDRFEARGKRWTVLSDRLAVCNDIVGKACFRESVDWTEKLADAKGVLTNLWCRYYLCHIWFAIFLNVSIYGASKRLTKEKLVRPTQMNMRSRTSGNGCRSGGKDLWMKRKAEVLPEQMIETFSNPQQGWGE